MAEINNIGMFNEFPPVSKEQWEEQINKDLKGADYEKKLIWRPFEGAGFSPYYRMEDLQDLQHLDSLPGQYPFVRGNKTDNNHWEIRQDIQVTGIKEGNKKALDAIACGAEAISFSITEISREEDMAALLKGIDLTKVPVHFISSFSYSILADMLLYALRKGKTDPASAHGSFNFDSIAYYVLHGEFYNSADDNFNEAACLIRLLHEKLPLFRVINVNGQHFHNAGANTVQELAWVLASASEYFAQLTERGLSADEISKSVQLTFATGSDYFPEIAKIRVARMLWARMAEQYGCKENTGQQVYIHCINSFRNKTVYDPWVNILRTTTEAMSAATGGADAITDLPLNFTYRDPDVFAERISRNTNSILKNESMLDKVADPAAGSYYIENLTDQIAKLAWNEFVKIEGMGGFLKAFASGYIIEEVDKTCRQRDMEIATRKLPVLGTTIFPNVNEEMISEVKKNIHRERSGGLKIYRGSEAFEELRLSTEIHANAGNKLPSVLLIGYGNLAMRKARVNFATNFFGVAGYKILEEFEAAGVKPTLHHIMETDPDIIVYCSADAEYDGLAAQISKAAKAEPSVKAIHVIAGNPLELMQALKAAGIDDFIHIRSNLLETLRGFHERLGIKMSDR